MVANNTFLTRHRREPVRRAAAGQRVQQPHHRPPAAAAPVPGLRRHQHDEQRRQVLVPLRPGRPAEAVLEGLHPGALLHLLALEQATEYLNAGDAEPTRMISDLDVPHRLSISGIFELPVRQGPAVPVGRERAHERAPRRLADPGRLHVPDGIPGDVRQPARTSFPPANSDAFYNGGDRLADDRTPTGGSTPTPSRPS